MKKGNIDRRGFLKRLGLGVSAAGLTLAGCDNTSKKLTQTETKIGSK